MLHISIPGGEMAGGTGGEVLESNNFIDMEDRSQRERQTGEQQRGVSFGKAFSDRPARKDERVLQRGRSSAEPIPEAITYLLMKQKFEQIYRRIQKMSFSDEPRSPLSPPSPDASLRAIHFTDREAHPEICKVKTSQLYPKRSALLPHDYLEINTVGEPFPEPPRNKSTTPVPPAQPLHVLRKSRYRRKMLEPVGKSKMSNNIKDYLSVQRISIRDMQASLIAQKSKLVRQYNVSNLLAMKGVDSQEIQSCPSVDLSPVAPKAENFMLRRVSKFKPPFQLYHYRDFLWQVAYSNGTVVEPVEEYEGKVKMFIGPGNNSNLIKGILRRRSWYAITDKVHEANVVWTQIKVPGYFSNQQKGQRLPPIAEDEPPLPPSPKQKHSNPLLNPFEQQKWEQYWKVNIDRERKIKQPLKGRSRAFNLTETPVSKIRAEVKIHNHFVNNFIIGNKKALFKTMSEYYSSLGQDVFQYLPLTFHIKNNLEDDEYLKFLQHFYAIGKAAKTDPLCLHKHNAWIVKPGENTNRGNGIIVCLELNEIKSILKRQEKHSDGSLKTYILQKYIQRPLLYKKRKFDLRHYIMLNCAHGRMKGYWYREGYVRTTSTQYTLKISNGSIHLTNDAVQKTLPQYGKYEKGNKIYYEQLDQYIKKQDASFDFWKVIYPKMKQRATDVIHASALNIDPDRRINNFQIFGLDFMIDADYNVWLIEVNTNPCLETTCPVLNKIIPKFIQNTLQICIDPVFPAPLGFAPKYQGYLGNLAEENGFELVFDQRIDGAKSIGESVLAGGAEEEDDVFDDDGEDFDQGE